MLPSYLEDWLTETGDRVVSKAASGDASLTPSEQLLFEVWLFDTEQRNGGVSQYFFNRGRAQWTVLLGHALKLLPSLQPFAAEVESVISDAPDPYEAIIDSNVHLDEAYMRVQTQLVTELRRQFENL